MILIFISIVLFVIVIFGFLYKNKTQVNERLDEISKMEGANEEDEDIFKKPMSERVVQPFIRSVGNFLGNLTPMEIKQNIEKRIVYAGRPSNITYNNLMIISVVIGIGLPLGLFLLLGLVGWTVERLPLMIVALALLGLYLPVMVINSKVSNRQKTIQKSLPDMLDLLLVSVEAGLGFDMALKRVAEKKPGELSKEINRALEEIRVGKTRSEALRDIYERTGVEDIRAFVSAVIQAEQLGANIARTLGIQADTMREKRRQRAETAAMKAPVKMIFPLVFFIFPALFVVLLGPAVIQIFNTIMSGAF